MADEFYLRLLSRAGANKRAAVTDYLSFIYRNEVNKPGQLDFNVRPASGIPTILEMYDQVEVWRRNTALRIPWHVDFYGLFMDSDYATDENGLDVFTGQCVGQQGILGFRHNSWPAGVANRSTFTNVPAETALKTLVRYNATIDASVANGRIREGDLGPGMGFTITIEADSAEGNLVSKSLANGNLLGTLSETIAPVAGGDFSLAKTGAATWQFRWHLGQLGEDKSSGPNQVEFSLERNNMLSPRLRIRRSEARSVAIVGGQGPGSARFYTVVTGPDYAANNDRELFVDARNEDSEESRQTEGDVAMQERRIIEELLFDVLQTPSVFYSRVAVTGRKTYREGDLTLAKYKGVAQVRKVTAVTVESSKQGGGSPPTQIQVDTEVVTA